MGVSQAQAYRIIRKLNDELEKNGFMIIAGKVSRLFLEEKFYGIKEVNSNANI